MDWALSVVLCFLTGTVFFGVTCIEDVLLKIVIELRRLNKQP